MVADSISGNKTTGLPVALGRRRDLLWLPAILESPDRSGSQWLHSYRPISYGFVGCRLAVCGVPE